MPATTTESDTCDHCLLRLLCMPGGSTSCDKLRVRHSRVLTAGSLLYRQGEPARGIFVVQAGALRLSNITSGGEEVVTGFALSFESTGLEALFGQKYQRQATALDRVVYCEISANRLLHAAQEAPAVATELLRLTTTALQQSMQRAAVAHRDARARVAGFLLDISQRLADKGSSQFRLPMPRCDIAQYLGLSMETVSRVLQDLHRRGLIAIRARAVELQSFRKLAAVAAGQMS